MSRFHLGEPPKRGLCPKCGKLGQLDGYKYCRECRNKRRTKDALRRVSRKLGF